MPTTFFPVSKYFVILTIVTLGCYAITIPPNGVVCLPSQWQDIITFFLVNYLAHAATVPAAAGAKLRDSLFWTVLSLLLPFAGLGRSVSKMANYLDWNKDDVQKAISQGAMIVVARSKDWEPASTHEELVYVDLPQDFDNPTET
jgi:hypothetical protein